MSGVLGVVGGLIQAKGAMDQAEAEAKAHEYNAAVDVRNREVISQQTGAAIEDNRQTSFRQLAAIRSKYASAGVTMTGSAADVLIDTEQEQTLARRRILYQGSLQNIEQTDDMNLQLMSADNARKAGKISAAAAILNGLSSAVSSFGNMG